jgi:hypothetical protein
LDFLPCGSLRVCLHYDKPLLCALRERYPLTNSRFEDRELVISERFYNIPSYSRIYDFTINRKYGFKVRLDNAQLIDANAVISR